MIPTWQIIVAERGWVFVGKVSRDGDQVRIADASNIRRWSLKTLDGLGGLAERGPGAKENDVLDRLPITRVHVLAIVATLECNAENWDRWLASAPEPKARKR